MILFQNILIEQHHYILAIHTQKFEFLLLRYSQTFYFKMEFYGYNRVFDFHLFYFIFYFLNYEAQLSGVV